jgi:hypothetical protein
MSGNANELIFNLDDGVFKKFSIIKGKKSEVLIVKLKSNVSSVVDDLNQMLNTDQEALEFYSSDACTLSL